MRRIERDVCYYLDQREDTERLRQMFQNADRKREQRNHRYTVTAFWFGVIGFLAAIVFVKLWTMGAVVGVK
jgi:hypothetical protein